MIERDDGARRIFDPGSERASGAFFYDATRRRRLWVSDFCLRLLRERGAFTVDTVSGKRIITTTWRVVNREG